MPGWEKFTLDEVIHPDEEKVAGKRSDDVPEEELELTDKVEEEGKGKKAVKDKKT